MASEDLEYSRRVSNYFYGALCNLPAPIIMYFHCKEQSSELSAKLPCVLQTKENPSVLGE